MDLNHLGDDESTLSEQLFQGFCGAVRVLQLVALFSGCTAPALACDALVGVVAVLYHVVTVNRCNECGGVNGIVYPAAKVAAAYKAPDDCLDDGA